MAIQYYDDVIQGSDEWFSLRCGIQTASEMKNVINAELVPVKPTKKEMERGKDITHLYELLSQRITGYIERSYVSDDMIRGHEDEIYAKAEYSEKYAPVKTMGFITNDKWGFRIGYSPDGLVGDNGLIEVKSRRQKYQVETILLGEVPPEFMVQVQTGMMVSEREWCDYITYRGGVPMKTLRIEADEKIQKAIINAATDFEERLQKQMRRYVEILQSDARLIPTERRIAQEMHL